MMMGPTKKKVITASVVAFTIPVVLGSIFFVSYNKKKTEEIERLTIQSQVVERFVFAKNMVAGDIITAQDVVGVQVKAESAPIDSFEGKDYLLNDIVGKRMRINAEEKTMVTASMFMEEEDKLNIDERYQEFNMITLPSDLMVGDFVDVRLTAPTGENYIVISGKEVKQIGTTAESNAMFLQLNEEEILRTTAAIIESYLDDGYKIYANKYVNPSEQLYSYTRVNYVEMYKKALEELLKEKQDVADANPVEYLKQYRPAEFEKVSGDIETISGDIGNDIKVVVSEDEISTGSILERMAIIARTNNKKFEITVEQVEDIEKALKEGNETVISVYSDKLITTRKNMINTYPVKENIAKLIAKNPNILSELKSKYSNIDDLKAQRESLQDYPLYDYDEYGEMGPTEALSKLQEKINKEIETQKAERKEYLQALILDSTM